MKMYTVADFDYHLPEGRIAQYPADHRENAKLMILDRATQNIVIDRFKNVTNYLSKQDTLVLNETRVIPARLLGKKTTGAHIEIFLLEQIDDNHWRCLVKPGKKLLVGTTVVFGDNLLRATIVQHGERGERVVAFDFDGDFFSILDQVGSVPLPPYIKRHTTPDDATRYQTVYAHTPGSVAAPTAGLHFTKEILHEISKENISLHRVNLNIGLGTFRPVQTEHIEDHIMHREYCAISQDTAAALNREKMNGKKILAVGTTAVRTLESFSENNVLYSGEKWTDIFIYPGYNFRFVDKLLTNFHLPKSTLLMLVAALAGHDFVMHAYERAIQENFRFYSYGDAMLIL